MNLIAQFNFFWQKHPEYAFKPLEIAVYAYLLNFCNGLGRKNPFNLAKERLMFEMGLRTEDALDTARKRLREAGLIQYENGYGRGRTTLYTLLPPPSALLKSATTDDAEKGGEKGVKNHPFSVEASCIEEPVKGGVKGGKKSPLLEDGNTEKGGEKGVKNTPNKGGTTLKKRKEDSSSAASAAVPATSSSISEKPEPKPKRGAGKPKGASPAEIAGLALPFAGDEFAAIWRSFYTTNPKQFGKALTAFELMLKKLGKYPEGFAVVMVEKAIMGSWSGIENEGTARDYQRWLAEEARRPAPATTAPAAPTEAPASNPEFIAQQQARADAARADLLARRTATA